MKVGSGGNLGLSREYPRTNIWACILFMVELSFNSWVHLIKVQLLSWNAINTFVTIRINRMKGIRQWSWLAPSKYNYIYLSS